VLDSLREEPIFKIDQVPDCMKTIGINCNAVFVYGLALATVLKPFGQVVPKKKGFINGSN
jgi:hypothetical protein